MASNKIAEITTVIDEIAFQTNLLATMTQQNAALVEKAADAAQTLNQQAINLIEVDRTLHSAMSYALMSAGLYFI